MAYWDRQLPLPPPLPPRELKPGEDGWQVAMQERVEYGKEVTGGTPETDACQCTDGSNPDCDELVEKARALERQRNTLAAQLAEVTKDRDLRHQLTEHQTQLSHERQRLQTVKDERDELAAWKVSAMMQLAFATARIADVEREAGRTEHSLRDIIETNNNYTLDVKEENESLRAQLAALTSSVETDRRRLVDVCKKAQVALRTCYDVVEYPGNGKTCQDKALAALDAAISGECNTNSESISSSLPNT